MKSTRLLLPACGQVSIELVTLDERLSPHCETVREPAA
jgi:hypothetical protein